MEDKKYLIHSWNPVLLNKSLSPLPCLYIKMDNDLKQLLIKDNLLQVSVYDTNSIYDGHIFDFKIYNSGIFPNYRPNFFNITGYYCVVIYSNWYYYPKDNGYIIFNKAQKTQPVQQNILSQNIMNSIDNVNLQNLIIPEKSFIPSLTDILPIPKELLKKEIKQENKEDFVYIKPNNYHIIYLILFIIVLVMVIVCITK